MASSLPQEGSVRPSDGKVATVSYVELEIYDDADAKTPTHRITVILKLCLFEVDGRPYQLATEGTAFYDAVLRASRAAR